MYANTVDRIFALLLIKSKIYGEGEISILKKYVKKGQTVCDVGANIGLFTLELARAVGSEGCVTAFEPDPNNFALLNKNIQANGYKNVTLIQKAVSKSDGDTRLYCDSAHHGNHCIYNPNDGRSFIEVQTTSLDNYYKEREKIDFIKIDVEGAECLVFEGMENIVKNNPDLTILSEFCPFLLEKAGFSSQRFVKWASLFKFNLFSVLDESHIDISSVRGKAYVNLLLMRDRVGHR